MILRRVDIRTFLLWLLMVMYLKKTGLQEVSVVVGCKKRIILEERMTIQSLHKIGDWESPEGSSAVLTDCFGT